jgi:hypothetical protein
MGQNVLQLTQQTGSANTSSILYAVTGGNTDTGLPLSVLFTSAHLTTPVVTGGSYSGGTFSNAQIASPTIAGGSADNISIGGLTPGPASFTTLSWTSITGGTVPVANGGTGAASAATARTNLGAASTGANTFTGNQTISASGSPQFVVNDTSGTGTPRVQLQSNAVNAWALVSDNTANTFALFRYVGGTLTDRPVSFASGTGAASFTVRPTFNGATPWDSANLPSPAQTTGATFTGAIVPSQTIGITGTTTNNNANAGAVGEYMTGAGSAIALTNNVATNITSVTLTAGDWEVTGSFTASPAATTIVNLVAGGLSLTSATLPVAPDVFVNQATFVTGAQQSSAIPSIRVSVAGSTQVFLVGQVGFSVSTCTGAGRIRARRVR